MVSALVSRSGLSPGWGHCAVFLSKTLKSHSAPLHPGVYNEDGYRQIKILMLGDTLRWTSIQSTGE